jgi:type II secretory ATPase GspE/PulE/Tfp pilus assembly ATPase PilB-like protein
MLSTHLLAIIAQRLIRKLCPHCKKERAMKDHEALLLQLSPSHPLFTAEGCTSCRGTGYKGRLAIAEILVFDQELEECLTTTSSRLPLKALAKKKGFIPMAQDARHRVLRGDTTLEEILNAVSLEDTK